MPITLRWLRVNVLPTIGPRSRGSPRPQRIGNAPCPPSTGCEVRRMCFAERCLVDIARHPRTIFDIDAGIGYHVRHQRPFQTGARFSRNARTPS